METVMKMDNVIANQITKGEPVTLVLQDSMNFPIASVLQWDLLWLH